MTRAIKRAEEQLDGPEGKLFSLGAIVHNDAELSRLGAKGLVTIDKEDLEEMQDASGETLLIRAHGEPPATYAKAEQLHFKVIDCTCPVVLKLQERIREAHARLTKDGRQGQIIIFGKIGHAEVLGLVGQVGGDATVIEDLAMLEEKINDGTISLTVPTEVFSQTTKSPAEYATICSRLEELMAGAAKGDCGSRTCEKAEKIIADLWVWKYLNDTCAADRALECWDTLKSEPLDKKCGNCMFRLGRLCVEVADMF